MRKEAAFPFAMGVDAELESTVVPLDNFDIAGGVDALDDSAVIIRAGLASALGIEVGDSVDIYSPLKLQDSQGGELSLLCSFDFVIICSTSWNQVDVNPILLDVKAIREPLGMEDGDSHGLALKLHSCANIEKYVAMLRKRLTGMRILSRQDLNSKVLFVLKLEKNYDNVRCVVSSTYRNLFHHQFADNFCSDKMPGNRFPACVWSGAWSVSVVFMFESLIIG
jgi:ABC-type lipoprotein release transport system permease subunit